MGVCKQVNTVNKIDITIMILYQWFSASALNIYASHKYKIQIQGYIWVYLFILGEGVSIFLNEEWEGGGESHALL